MTFILLAILCSTANQLLFKVFDRIRVAVLPAIVVNYLVAFGLGGCLGGGGVFPGKLSSLHLHLLAAVQGGVLAGCFLLMSAVTRRNGVAVAAVSTRLAVVIPVIAAFMLYGESVLVGKIAGVLLAVGALVLLKPEEGGDANARSSDGRLLPLLLFLGFGLNLAYTKWVQARFLPPETYHNYLTVCFLWAFAWGLAALLTQRGLRLLKPKEGIAGILLGINNYGAIFFLIAALAQPGWESSVIFPLVSVSVVLLSFMAGILLFGERITARKGGAVLLGVLALVLIY